MEHSLLMSVATDAGREQRRGAPVLRTVLEVAVVVIFAFLVWNNFALRRQQDRSAAAAKGVRGFAVREQLGAIPAMTLDGRRSDLDLRHTRGVVAIVNPGCESCRELIASARNAPDVHVLSVAPASDLGPNARILPQSPGGALGARLQVAPQVFVIDRGRIVRTCATIAECR